MAIMQAQRTHTGDALPGRVYEAATTIAAADEWLRAELQSAPTLNVWGPLYHSLIDAPVFWAHNVWLEPFRLEFSSIKNAAAALRAIQRNWCPTFFTCFRRGELIQNELPPLSHKPRAFPWQLPDAPIGAWTLLDEHTLIASARCSSPFPGGGITFEEDKNEPPSRAYLKLWEALTVLRARPRAGERCLDAGASPGGWTWALARMGADILAIDRAPLAERIARMPGVRFMRHDAFTVKPEDIGAIDWLFCDVICYPPRLYEWVEKWLGSGLCRNFVCTIKMQGTIGGESCDALRRFAAIPDSRVLHLHHNKHELTWMKRDTCSAM
ncbi:MAG: hypothetical protein LBS86_01760 [Treponema sp.]|jgi:23S rRNA (cytidine2498-2'-O)-methyltransferase|nr:hypothetical protein [Treponema sp.]